MNSSHLSLQRHYQRGIADAEMYTISSRSATCSVIAVTYFPAVYAHTFYSFRRQPSLRHTCGGVFSRLLTSLAVVVPRTEFAEAPRSWAESWPRKLPARTHSKSWRPAGVALRTNWARGRLLAAATPTARSPDRWCKGPLSDAKRLPDSSASRSTMEGLTPATSLHVCFPH